MAHRRPGGEAEPRGGALEPLHRGPLPALPARDGAPRQPAARQGRRDPADRRHGVQPGPRGHVRRRHRPSVRLRHRHPLRLDRHQRLHGRVRPPLRRRVLGGRRRARRLGALTFILAFGTHRQASHGGRETLRSIIFRIWRRGLKQAYAQD